jgi:hypothetical protein
VNVKDLLKFSGFLEYLAIAYGKPPIGFFPIGATLQIVHKNDTKKFTALRFYHLGAVIIAAITPTSVLSLAPEIAPVPVVSAPAMSCAQSRHYRCIVKKTPIGWKCVYDNANNGVDHRHSVYVGSDLALPRSEAGRDKQCAA